MSQRAVSTDRIDLADEMKAVYSEQEQIAVETIMLNLKDQAAVDYFKQNGFEYKWPSIRRLQARARQKADKAMMYSAIKGFKEQHFGRLAKVYLMEKLATQDLIVNGPNMKDGDRSKLRQEIASYQPLISEYEERTQYVFERQAKSMKLAKEAGMEFVPEVKRFAHKARKAIYPEHEAEVKAAAEQKPDTLTVNSNTMADNSHP